MARSGSQAGSSASAASPSPSTHRISKRVATRMTRQSSRLAASSSICIGLNSMESEARVAQDVAGHDMLNVLEREEMEMDEDIESDDDDDDDDDAIEFFRSICPITDKDEMPFLLMDLPTEIRLEIYRACLTRPHSILLSKQPQPPKAEGGHDFESSGDDAPRCVTGRRSIGVTAVEASETTPANFTAAARAPTMTFRDANSGGDSTYQVLVPAGTQGRPQPKMGRCKSRRGDESQRNQCADPLLTNILRVSKEVYKEARGVLYSENYFRLDLSTAQSTLACLHQRSRRQIKHIELEIPSYNDILERFQETVRLSLRYCSGLKECLIHMPFMLPGADGSGTSGNTTVYANGFDILRWLPQECNIILEGRTCVEIEQVVNKHRQLAKTLDKLAYARRQLISNENAVQQS